MPRVQRAAEEFRDQWNNHGLSTGRGALTPLQLWQRGMLNVLTTDVFKPHPPQGIDEHSALLPGTGNNVVIPENHFNVNETTRR